MAGGRPSSTEPRTKGAQRLFEWLRENDVTYSDFAAEIGISQPPLSRLLIDPKPNNKLQLFARIKELTGISIDDWIEPPDGKLGGSSKKKK